MAGPDNEIKWIKDKLTNLEKTLSDLEKTCQRRFESVWDHESNLTKHLRLHNSEIVDIYQRLINLEVKTFPHLLDDLGDVQRVLGTKPGLALNPLDQIPLSKKHAKKPKKT